MYVLFDVDLTDDSLQWLVWMVRVFANERILFHVVPFYLAYDLQAFFLLVSFIYDLHLDAPNRLQICVDRLHIGWIVWCVLKSPRQLCNACLKL